MRAEEREKWNRQQHRGRRMDEKRERADDVEPVHAFPIEKRPEKPRYIQGKMTDKKVREHAGETEIPDIGPPPLPVCDEDHRAERGFLGTVAQTPAPGIYRDACEKMSQKDKELVRPRAIDESKKRAPQAHSVRVYFEHRPARIPREKIRIVHGEPERIPEHLFPPLDLVEMHRMIERQNGAVVDEVLGREEVERRDGMACDDDGDDRFSASGERLADPEYSNERTESEKRRCCEKGRRGERHSVDPEAPRRRGDAQDAGGGEQPTNRGFAASISSVFFASGRPLRAP